MQRRYRKRKPKRMDLKVRLRVNHQIKASIVKVIDEEGAALGDMKLEEALKLAREAELDLVEVSPKSSPPVVRIADYGQVKYDRDKKLRKQKLQQKTTETKGVRLSFRIKGADLDTRANQALKFLKAGNNVKVELILRGRERAHQDKAIELVKFFITQLGDDVVEITPMARQGGRISVEIAKK